MHHSGKVSLMIVEDDDKIRFLLETAAQRSGRFGPITSASDGQDALLELKSRETSRLPAWIITDLSMPRLNGLELLQAVKSEPRLRHINVAIITSSDGADDRALALAGGACAFVAKPFGLQALVRALVGVLDSCSEEAQASIAG
jgi:CheY-like chemotaxis protein